MTATWVTSALVQVADGLVPELDGPLVDALEVVLLDQEDLGVGRPLHVVVVFGLLLADEHGLALAALEAHRDGQVGGVEPGLGRRDAIGEVVGLEGVERGQHLVGDAAGRRARPSPSTRPPSRPPPPRRRRLGGRREHDLAAARWLTTSSRSASSLLKVVIDLSRQAAGVRVEVPLVRADHLPDLVLALHPHHGVVGWRPCRCGDRPGPCRPSWPPPGGSWRPPRTRRVCSSGR